MKSRSCNLTAFCLFSLLALIPTVSSTQAAVITLQLDFGASGTPVTSGYTPVIGNFLANTPVASVSNIAGTGYGFSINNVAVYSSGNAAEPLTTDGFYTFGNNTLDHSFTISGLSAGDQVDLYAVAAWDGNGRGAQIVFGSNTVKAQTIGTPGTTPTLSNFTSIGSLIATGSTVIGSINGAGFPGNPATEGQVGGFIVQVTTVPEPSTVGLIGVGFVGMLALRRRASRLIL